MTVKKSDDTLFRIIGITAGALLFISIFLF